MIVNGERVGLECDGASGGWWMRGSPDSRCRPGAAAAATSDVLPSDPAVRTPSWDVESRADSGLASSAMYSVIILIDGVGPGLAVFQSRSSEWELEAAVGRCQGGSRLEIPLRLLSAGHAGGLLRLLTLVSSSPTLVGKRPRTEVVV